MSNLVIVESPAKAKTIKKYLGDGFEVIASMGHVRDLLKSKMGIDFENNFEPQYTEMKGKEDVVKDIRRRAKKSSKIFLATDPDREGEAISWHLAQLLNLDLEENNRVTFNEITKSGIQSGMNNLRKIDMDLVNAQQARRILDRIVGYKLSPFLWKKVRRGLSAGRVQSVAVRLIVDRENEIRKFVAKEYWSIDAKFTAPGSRKIFPAALVSINGKKFELGDKIAADGVLEKLKNTEYTVTSVKKKVAKKQPAPPFITSTLQQEASRRMGFTSKRTMKAAQELYEGIDVKGMGAVGLITYMRTDSLRISDEARNAAAEYIEKTYGKEYLPDKPRFFKSKKGAQDAHEAIRPSMPALSPDKVKSDLSTDQFKLYKLIWERFIASQMANALHDTVSVDISAHEFIFRATGYSVKFDGFTTLYVETADSNDEENVKILPPMEVDDKLKLKTLSGNQHFTQPPPRYSEASLIKTLEENGIGRPSTYAPTISTITSRMYVEIESKQLRPTPLGEVTTELMKDYFKAIVDAKFTAQMEDELDGVEHHTKDWVEVLRNFYGDFEKTLDKAEQDMEGKRYKIPVEETDEICDKCGRQMVIKIGRFGKFIACPGYPECTNTKKIVKEAKGFCPLCGKKMLIKKAKKRGRSFYGCEGYPECNFMTWSTPTDGGCPKCGSTLFKKGGKAAKLTCEKPECGFERSL